MNIGQAARRSGLPAKTIRYYESIGLIRPDRRDNNYRDYGGDLIHKLRFVHRARDLGFSVADCRHLLALYEDKSRASADVRKLASARLVEIDAKIRALTDLRRTLEHLVHACHGNDRPNCPILEELADDKPA